MIKRQKTVSVPHTHSCRQKFATRSNEENGMARKREGWLVGLVIALRPETPKHIRGGWSHYTDTSEPVDCNGAQNIVTVQSRFEPATLRPLTHVPALTGPTEERERESLRDGWMHELMSE
jgi:hypothetical protein